MKDKHMETVKNVLEKYENGAVIASPEDDRILDECASTGMVRYGFDYKTRRAEAALTEQGKRFLKQL